MQRKQSTGKKAISRMGKIAKNHIPDKQLIFKIFNKLLQLNSKNKTKQISKMGKGLKWTFLQRRHKMDNRYMKKCSTSLIIRKMQIKTTVRASLVAQWLGIRLPMQGTWVRALLREDPTYCGATNPMCHNFWACALELASHNY